MRDRKIYLVTFSGQRNYGGLLQATALTKILKNLGYDVSLLRKWRVLSYLFIHPSLFFARIINRFNTKTSRDFFNPSPYEINKIRKQRNDQFWQDNLHPEDITNRGYWREIIRSNAIFISGSDIIWQPANGYPAKFFLDFVYYTKLNRFSYASSFGATELPHKYYHAYKKYLSKFSGISIREKSAAKMLEDIIGRKVQTVVDPTMLLTREQWDEYASRANFSKEIPKKFVLCYFVMDDERYWEYVKKIVDATNLPVVVLPMHYNDEKQPYTIIDDATPYEFIQLIKSAEFICTDSFHACVFSTIYEKEFYLLRRKRKDEDAKYDDFLNHYKLRAREIKDEEVFVRNSSIDYTNIRTIVDSDRTDSLAYLRDCLK